MSVEALSIVLNHSRATGAVKLVLMGIANHVSPDNDGAWPSQTRLAGYANCSERYVRDAIEELVSLGELRYESHGGVSKGGNKSNRYWLTISCPPECDGSVNHKSGKPGTLSQIPGTLSHNTRNPSSAEPLLEPLKEPIRKATKISPDFKVTQEMVDWFVDSKIPVDPNAQTALFIDYYIANGTTRKDWAAAWRNWMRKAVEYQKTPWDRAKETQAVESRQKTDADKEYTKKLLEDSARAREAATAPPKCQHGKTLAMCIPCSSALS